MYTKRAEFKAGVVVLLALAALLALAYFAGGSEPIWGDYRYVHVRFEQSFTAPKVGDPALMNGMSVGRVSEVHQREEVRGEGGSLPLTPEDRRRLGLAEGESGTVREVYVLAVIKMDASQRLPRGTTAQIGKSLTGIRELSLLPGISRENVSDEMTHEDPLPGREAPGLADITDKVNGLVEKVESLVGSGTEVMAEAKALLRTLREKIAAFDTQELDRDARAAVAALRRTLEQAEERIDRIAGNLESASVSIQALAAKGSETMDVLGRDLIGIAAEIRAVVARIDRLIEGAEGPVADVLADLRQTSHAIRSATEGVAALGPDARALLAELGVDLHAFVRNLNDTAHNLLDASEDLRTHPWKLLNKPDAADIAFANLRNASQSYMRAMRDVNEASARLFQLLARPDLDRPEIQELVRKALEAFDANLAGYRETEERWQKLFREASTER